VTVPEEPLAAETQPSSQKATVPALGTTVALNTELSGIETIVSAAPSARAEPWR